MQLQRCSLHVSGQLPVCNSPTCQQQSILMFEYIIQLHGQSKRSRLSLETFCHRHALPVSRVNAVCAWQLHAAGELTQHHSSCTLRRCTTRTVC
jgi:hypothetical protein